MSTTKPILRIFDYERAIAHYIDWLGFSIDWQHQFEENTPIYLQVSMGDLVLHLSEHSGDGTPGTRVFIDDFKGIEEYHRQLLEKKYKYNRPSLEVPFYDEQALSFTAIDPFHNQLIFVERNVEKQFP